MLFDLKKNVLEVVFEEKDLKQPSPISGCVQLLKAAKTPQVRQLMFDLSNITTNQSYIVILYLQMIRDEIKKRMIIKNINNNHLLNDLYLFNQKYPTKKIEIKV